MTKEVIYNSLIRQRCPQAELLELVAKDEEAKEAKKAKRKAKKRGGGGRGDVPLCGCGAACDGLCQQPQRRSVSPVRQQAAITATPPRTPPRPRRPAASDDDDAQLQGSSGGGGSLEAAAATPAVSAKAGGSSPGRKKQQQARDMLGLDLVASPSEGGNAAAQTPSRPPTPLNDLAPSPGGGDGWETIPVASKRRGGGNGNGALGRKFTDGSAAAGTPDAQPQPPQQQTPHIIVCPRPAPGAAAAPPSSAGSSPVVRAVPFTAARGQCRGQGAGRLALGSGRAACADEAAGRQGCRAEASAGGCWRGRLCGGPHHPAAGGAGV